jgi:hypothetical protein
MNDYRRLALRYAIMKAAFKAACKAWYTTMATANDFSKKMRPGESANIKLEIVLDGTSYHGD